MAIIIMQVMCAVMGKGTSWFDNPNCLSSILMGWFPDIAFVLLGAVPNWGRERLSLYSLFKAFELAQQDLAENHKASY